MKICYSSLLPIARKFLNAAFLFLTAIVVMVPLNPQLPGIGLDPSWMLVLNEAIAQGWIFGKDIIFTFGPYASICTRMYHPATDHLMLFGSLFLSICYAQLLILLTKTMNFRWVLAYALFITGFIYGQDAILFSYPLILFLVTYRFSLYRAPSGFVNFDSARHSQIETQWSERGSHSKTMADEEDRFGKVAASQNSQNLTERGIPKDHPSALNLSRSAVWILIACFSPLGLLPLIKGSFLPASGAAIILCSILFWHSKHKALSYAAFISPVVSGAIFWMLSGQPLNAIPVYFKSLIFIISGYQEAMAITGDKNEVLLYVFTSLAILGSIALYKIDSLIHKICLFSALAFSLFIAFKAGFIRHDSHAASISAPFIVIVAFLLFTIRSNKKIFITIFSLSIFTWGYIDSCHFRTSTESILHNLKSNYNNVEKGIQNRLFSKRKLKKAFEKRLQEIHNALAVPNLTGSSDIYSFQQSFLLSSTNTFSLRPIFQSYSAYTPELAKINENHIRSKNAPDNILFCIETMDSRLPSLDDGLSWPTIIDNYCAEKFENNLIFFKKIKPIQSDFIETEIYSNEHRMNREVFLPEATNYLYAEIEINQTFAGKIRSLLYKPSELYIIIQLVDGRKSRYRFIANMSKSRFLISPLVENTLDFYSISKAETNGNGNKLVKSIKIEGNRTYWNKYYRLKFKTIEYADPGR